MTEQNANSSPNPPASPPPTSKPSRSRSKPAAAPPSVSHDAIRRLIAALDQPNDSLHAQAADDLIALGPQAVPALSAAITNDGPWLRAFRATEALGQIGDGRASRALVTALRHPHSNVRWSAVQSLAKVGDSRTILALRRVARQDRGKTSWGESVAATAQNALNEMQGRSAILRLSDPIKIALLVAAALFAVWLASGRVQAFRAVVNNPADTALWGTEVVPIIPTIAPDATEEPEEEFTDLTPSPTAPLETATPTVATTTATVTAASANVRSAPNTDNTPIARLVSGNTVQIIAQAGEWYRIRLPEGTEGWIAASVLSPPSGPVPTATN